MAHAIAEITTTAMPANGYINCIAVDPFNTDRILLAFSTYQLYSLLLSTDGGITFSKCTGNLEAKCAG